MIAEKSQYIGSAYKRLQNISRDKQMQYEAREKAVRDYNQMMKEARESGEKIGVERSKGIIAENMIQMGFDNSTIAKATDIPEEKIDRLRK